MIVKRKIYSNRRDPLPDPFPIPEEWIGKFDNTEYVVDQVDKQYNKDMQELGPIDKQTVRKFRKDLKAGNIYQDGPNGGDTHYLADYSDPGKFHRLTKSINTFDRMDYLVYPPVLDEENRRVIIPIVIQSLKGHLIYGQGEYSETMTCD